MRHAHALCSCVLLLGLHQPGSALTLQSTRPSGELFCPETNATVTECAQCGDYTVSDNDDKMCIERSVFRGKYLANDAGAVFVCFVGAGLAMAAGVGGGGFYVALGLILLRFSAKPATGLSQSSVFGASLAGLIINTQSRHPVANRPVIDLDVALILAPMKMSGALLGVIVQSTLPNWVIIVLMATLIETCGVTRYENISESVQATSAGQREMAASIRPR